MKREIFKRFFFLMVISLAVCGVLLGFTLSKVMLEKTQQELLYSVKLADYGFHYDADLQEEAERVNHATLTERTRITLIDEAGSVLADTGAADLNLLENHSYRAEVREAVKNGEGAAVRYSSTLGQNMLFAAYRSPKSGYILRLGMPYDGVNEYIPILLPGILISCLIAFLISLYFARRFSKSISMPLTEISEELMKVNQKESRFHFKTYQYEELNHIVMAILKLSEDTRKSMSRLETERNKIDYILENMAEGFLLLDQNHNVLTINRAAKELLMCREEPKGKNLLHYNHNLKLMELLESGIGGSDARTVTIPMQNRIISVHASRIQEGVFGKNDAGTALLLLDVTAEQNAAKIRQEFFSNASHELKTPITSIQGYTELLQSGLFRDEAQAGEFLARIAQESKNMNGLINDILMISRLENHQQEEPKSNVLIAPLLEEISASLRPLAEQNHVAIQIHCDKGLCFTAGAQQMAQLFNNLMGNAVKYNRKNGSVSMTAGRQDGNLIFTVSDTGIGIPEEDRERVFERFYRVDAGRSRKIGGTGLGLSIVKHIVQSCHGRISLESEEGQGTKITVVLPETPSDETGLR